MRSKIDNRADRSISPFGRDFLEFARVGLFGIGVENTGQARVPNLNADSDREPVLSPYFVRKTTLALSGLEG